MTTTHTDIHLARVFYDILLDHAQSSPGVPIRYKDVLARARRDHPSDESVAGAIPVSIGRRLEVIVRFVRDHKLPPLTCIAVNETGRPGDSYKEMHGSWEADMDAVARFSWAQWKGSWDIYTEAARKAATPLKRRNEELARKIIHDEYVAGRIPKLGQDVKERLVELLKDGLPVNDAWLEIQGRAV